MASRYPDDDFPDCHGDTRLMRDLASSPKGLACTLHLCRFFMAISGLFLSGERLTAQISASPHHGRVFLRRLMIFTFMTMVGAMRVIALCLPGRTRYHSSSRIGARHDNCVRLGRWPLAQLGSRQVLGSRRRSITVIRMRRCAISYSL